MSKLVILFISLPIIFFSHTSLSLASSKKDKQPECEVDYNLIERENDKFIVKGIALIGEKGIEAAKTRAQDNASANLVLLSGVEASIKLLSSLKDNKGVELSITDEIIGDDPEEDLRKHLLSGKTQKTSIVFEDTDKVSYALLIRSDIIPLSISKIDVNQKKICGKEYIIVSNVVSGKLIEKNRENIISRIKEKRKITSIPVGSKKK